MASSEPATSFLANLQLGGLISLLLGGALTYVLANILYNLFGHPLREHPGPLLWRISRIPADYHLLVGDFNWQVVKIHERYGPIVRVAPGELSFTKSQAWKDVMEHRPEFPKPPNRVGVAPNGLKNILGADKDDHARYRRLLSHAFSEKGLREQEGRIQEFVDLLVVRLQEKAAAQETIDMVDWYTIAVFDVIGDLAWGESFGGLRKGEVHEWIPAILGNIKHLVQFTVFKRFGITRFSSILMSKKTLEARARNYKLALDKCQQRAKLEGVQGDFWDRVLIKSSNNNEAGEGMSQGEMIVNASTLVLAGAETSATTLSGATYLLLNNPNKMRKLAHEVRTTFNSSSEIDVLTVNRLKYTHAVITEVMRIYPPVPNPMVRIPPRGGGVVCGHWLPENTVINVHQLAMNRSPANFHKPLEFIPERWLDDAPAEFANDDKAAHQPFSAGIRNCIGKNLAYAEMRLILAKIVYNFDLELDSKRTGDWFDQMTWGIWFKGPLYVKLSSASPQQ